jgi:hypothetical protein
VPLILHVTGFRGQSPASVIGGDSRHPGLGRGYGRRHRKVSCED